MAAIPEPEPVTEPPIRPVPPRSRHRWHLGGVALAALTSPVAFWLLCLAVWETVASFVTIGRTSVLEWVAVLIGTLILALPLVWAIRSSVAAAAVGGLWMTFGAIAWFVPDTVEWLSSLVPGEASEGGFAVYMWGALLPLGAAMIAVAGAASWARRHGRRIETAEHRRLQNERITSPPRSRLGAHLSACVAALLGCAGTLWALSEQFLALRQLSSQADLWLIAAVLLAAAIGLVGAISSLGLATAGLAWGLLYILMQWAPQSLASWTDPSSVPVIVESTVTGPATAGFLAGIFGFGALAVHYARRDGRSIQRREYLLATATPTF